MEKKIKIKNLKFKKFRFLKNIEYDLWGNFIRKAKKNKFTDELQAIYKVRKRKFRQKYGKFGFRLDIEKPRKRLKRRSVFKKVLFYKNKLRKFYGTMREYQFRRIIHRLTKLRGFYFKNFFFSLETRIESILYRTYLIKTMHSARQYIRRGKVLVNGKIVKNFSYKLNDGDIISLKEPRWLQHKRIIEKLFTRGVYMIMPGYLEVNYKLMKIMILASCFKLGQIFYPFKVRPQIIYLYYRYKRI